jgi:PAS domain S-box-containing protein
MLHKIALVVFLAALVGAVPASGQERVDSLERQLRSAPRDTNRVNLLAELAQVYHSIDPQQAEQYGREALTLAQELNFPAGTAEARVVIGTSQWTRGNYERALKLERQALSTYEKLGDQRGITAAATTIGAVHQSRGKSDEKALQYYLKALRHAERVDFKRGIAALTNNVGGIFQDREEYEKALPYLRRSVHLKEKIGDRQGKAGTLSNIAHIYDERGQHEKAIKQLRKTLKINRALNDQKGLARDYNRLAAAHAHRGEHQKALALQRRSLRFARQIDDRRAVALAHLGMGTAYAETGRYERAQASLRESLALAREIGATRVMMEGYEGLSEVAEKRGQLEEALSYHKRYKTASDSIFDENKANQIARLRARYETDKKQQRIQLLEKESQLQTARLGRQRTLIAAGAGGLLLALLLAGVLYNRYRLKQRANDLLEERQAEIETQNEELEKLSLVARETGNAVLVAGAGGEIEWVNEGFRKATGLGLEEWRDRHGPNFLAASSRGDGAPPADGDVATEKRLRIREALREGTSALFEEPREGADGQTHWVASTLTPVTGPSGELEKLVVIERDITRRKKAEDRLAESLEEKKVLLREIHHRVKNNLQVIASLLELQLGEAPDPQTRASVREVQGRVKSMALIHRKLYQSGDLARVSFKAYAEELAEHFASAFGTEDVRCEVQADPQVRLNVDTAVPVGLITGELVSNALQHGLAGGAEGSGGGGTVTVSLRRVEGDLALRVADDGAGLPEGFDLRKTGSLGLLLVQDLAGQLDGSVRFDAPAESGSGTVCTVRFPAGAAENPAPSLATAAR